MAESFLAFRVHEQDGGVRGRLEEITLDDLSPGEVVVKVAWSTVNYKDALAATGKGKIMRRFPLVGGIDLAGHVVKSDDPRFREGDAVAINGYGLSEHHDGGYSEYARVPGDWLVRPPAGMSLRDMMALGTAGFTAGIAVDAMQHNHQHPGLGPVLVNGATGGVGSFAIDLLAGQGFEVCAFTGKREAEGYLKGLGAARVVLRGEVELGGRPLERALWGGAVDNVGGEELAWLTRTVEPMGNIAAVGLVGGVRLETTVMPFILRGVSLLGINSVLLPMERRVRVWERLGGDLRPRHIASIVTREVTLEELPGVFDEYIAGRVTGRAVVRIGGE